MSIISKNPANEEILKVYEELSDDEIEIKLENSKNAFAEWKKTDFASRANLMKIVAIKLREQKKELALLATLEMGKILAAGEAEVEKCALTCDFYADNSEAFLSVENIKTDASESFVRFDPIGSVLAVMPWNFPYWQVFRFAAPALMAGNVGLLKHASNVPQCALAIERIFIESGFAEGVFQTLLIGANKVDKIISDPRIAAVTLTGSEFAGSQVASTAGKEIKKAVLELGGSDPFIVLEDADLEKAIVVAAQARLQNNVGQSCISAKRFIVVESIAKRFTDGLVSEFKKLIIGDPQNTATNVGPLSSSQILKSIDEQVKKTILMGGILECGGKKFGERGYFYEPTVVSKVTKGMPLYDEEVFGPVAPVIIVQNEEEAIAVANDSVYGLGSTIFTKDIENAKRMAGQIEAGAVFINGMVKSDPRLPFGGIKKSGFGRELGSYGIKEFVNTKTVVVNEGVVQPSVESE